MSGLNPQPGKRWNYLTDIVLIALVTSAGAFFRLWKISTLPPGLSSDEADWGYITINT